MNPLIELQRFDQSFWYDNIRRKFLQDGTLQQLIEQNGLRGMTSNPAIFEKAIGQSNDYDEQMKLLAASGRDTPTIYEALVLADIQAACDLFSDLYVATDGQDGFVSLEVSPELADDTAGTIAEARRLFAAVGRPNVMIKVPATRPGIPAIRQLISDGINVNITLMFNLAHYEAVSQAYLEGLTDFVGRGGNPAGVSSVASFFVSRVDSAVDKQLGQLNRPAAAKLLGQAAIANAKIAYQRFKEIFHGPTFAPLQAAGANPQRLLWASTSTKNPNYPDTLYVDNLIGPQTVNTMPPETVEAFRDHGQLANKLETELDQAVALFNGLGKLGLDFQAITEQLQVEGVAAFSKAFQNLLQTIEKKRTAF